MAVAVLAILVWRLHDGNVAFSGWRTFDDVDRGVLMWRDGTSDFV